MADYNRNRRNYPYDQDWEHQGGNQNRNREYDQYGSFDRINYNREDLDRYRRENIGYDPYNDPYNGDYNRNRDYGHHDQNWQGNRQQGLSYNSHGQSGWDRRANEYGSYNAGYSDYDQQRRYNRNQDQWSGQQQHSYGAGGNYGSYGGPTGNRIPYREGEHRSTSGYRENRDWNRNRDHDDDKSFWERATDKVSSWFGGDDDDRRHHDERPGGQHKGKGPRGYSRSDERIREDISDRLSDDPYIDASDIEVKVSEGEVTLEGHAENKQAKRRAEDIAEAIAGVKTVSNHLKVSHTSATVGSSRVYTDRHEDKSNERKKGWF